MPQHELRFGHGNDALKLPICAVCLATVDGEAWASKEECPGPPTCRPPLSHIWLNGNRSCECGAMNDSDLIDMVTGEPAALGLF